MSYKSEVSCDATDTNDRDLSIAASGLGVSEIDGDPRSTSLRGSVALAPASALTSDFQTQNCREHLSYSVVAAL